MLATRKCYQCGSGRVGVRSRAFYYDASDSADGVSTCSAFIYIYIYIYSLYIYIYVISSFFLAQRFLDAGGPGGVVSSQSRPAARPLGKVGPSER